jgi:hypothetical protein
MERLNRSLGFMLIPLLLAIAPVASVHSASAHAPQGGDYFNYSETITVNNGQGSYAGYADQTQTTGMERMNSVSGDVVSAFYGLSYQYSNSQGSSTSSSTSGNYTWSSSSFTYLNGTDNQVGYSKPIYVWFAMNPSLPVGGTFYILNTQFAVQSKNYSLQLATEGNKYVQTIQAEGTGQYQRNDSYGVFTASYDWHAYFDPSTGYIVSYLYVEQDSGQSQGQSGSFTYTDALYLTSSSYALATANPPSPNNGGGPAVLDPYLGYLVALVVVLIVIAVAAYAVTRRRRRSRLPKHSNAPVSPPPAPSQAPWESKIDLGSKPPEQVVIRDVAKVNCKYCGSLIPTTADTCPYCGGPRR